MACRITELVLDCRDPAALSRWWCEVLDWVELDRDADVIEIGARPVDVGQTGDESWHVLVDPEGNEFCLLRSRVGPL